MREESFMVIIPGGKDDMSSPEIFLNNMKNNDYIMIEDFHIDEVFGMIMNLQVDGKPYEIKINPVEVEVPDFFRPEHAFSQEEIERIRQIPVGLSVCMDFDDDPIQCFYDQLRIIDSMFTEILAVMDAPSEKLLSGKWVSHAARSGILPAPRYLFTVQAISDNGEEVWLHTHGLKRCGLYDLEILCSTRDTCNDHYKMIETFANRMLEDEEGIEPGEGVFLAQAAGKILVCTAVDWKEALTYYPEATLGREEDRDEYHADASCVLMMYKGQEDEEKRIYSKIQEFDPYLQQNPMYMISNEETERMSRLAIERIPYLIEAAKNPEYTIILKIGLDTDPEYWEDGEVKHEHIWFELKEVQGDQLVAQLTQEPYYVSGIKEGDIGTYPFSKVTDWIIFTKEFRVTPDDVYMLELSK